MLTVFKQHKWKTAIITFLIALILILPYILQYAVKTAILDYTKPYGIEQVNLSDLSLNLFLYIFFISQTVTSKELDTSPVLIRFKVISSNISVSKKAKLILLPFCSKLSIIDILSKRYLFLIKTFEEINDL